jgi:hypothetical protein
MALAIFPHHSRSKFSSQFSSAFPQDSFRKHPSKKAFAAIMVCQLLRAESLEIFPAEM